MVSMVACFDFYEINQIGKDLLPSGCGIAFEVNCCFEAHILWRVRSCFSFQLFFLLHQCVFGFLLPVIFSYVPLFFSFLAWQNLWKAKQFTFPHFKPYQIQKHSDMTTPCFIHETKLRVCRLANLASWVFENCVEVALKAAHNTFQAAPGSKNLTPSVGFRWNSVVRDDEHQIFVIQMSNYLYLGRTAKFDIEPLSYLSWIYNSSIFKSARAQTVQLLHCLTIECCINVVVAAGLRVVLKATRVSAVYAHQSIGWRN